MTEIEQLKMQLEFAHESTKRVTAIYTDEINRVLDERDALRAEIKAHQEINRQLMHDKKRLERENAALREDKARLDWIACGFSLPMFLDGKWHCFEGEFSTFREAIDAERKEAQP